MHTGIFDGDASQSFKLSVTLEARHGDVETTPIELQFLYNRHRKIRTTYFSIHLADSHEP